MADGSVVQMVKQIAAHIADLEAAQAAQDEAEAAAMASSEAVATAVAMTASKQSQVDTAVQALVDHVTAPRG